MIQRYSLSDYKTKHNELFSYTQSADVVDIQSAETPPFSFSDYSGDIVDLLLPECPPSLFYTHSNP